MSLALAGNKQINKISGYALSSILITQTDLVL